MKKGNIWKRICRREKRKRPGREPFTPEMLHPERNVRGSSVNSSEILEHLEKNDGIGTGDEKELFAGRIERLDAAISGDTEYRKYQEQYHQCMEALKEILGNGQDTDGLVFRLDDSVSDYTSRYGEIIYRYAFHDGLRTGLEHERSVSVLEGQAPLPSIDLEDMTNLIYVCDAFEDLCTAVVGSIFIPAEHNGIMGMLGKIEGIAEKYIPPELKRGDDARGYRLLHDRRFSPEQRAGMLLGEK